MDRVPSYNYTGDINCTGNVLWPSNNECAQEVEEYETTPCLLRIRVR